MDDPVLDQLGPDAEHLVALRSGREANGGRRGACPYPRRLHDTVRLKRGIVTEPFLGLNYCDEASAGKCGA